MGYNHGEVKPALIAAVMLTFVIHLTPRGQSQKNTAEKEQSSHNKHPAALVPVAPPAKANPQNGPQGNQHAAHAQSPPWYESPEWVLVFIGAITAFVIGWQSWESRKSAAAALLNAKAVIDSERAWIHGEFAKNDPALGVIKYSLSVKNQGKTPAEIIGYDIWHGLLKEGVPFAKEKLTTHFDEPKHIFIGSNETLVLRDDFDLDDLFTLKSGELAKDSGARQGAFCVTIRYKNVVNEGECRGEHHTSFVYFCNLILSTIYRVPEYNEYT
ncbi:MAG TPA: hypothetical protein VGR81_10100 [Candidatus Acidoferrales bacterium]|nr:hypothetical protein [Candidatus Acidoferrales bacterium]